MIRSKQKQWSLGRDKIQYDHLRNKKFNRRYLNCQKVGKKINIQQYLIEIIQFPSIQL